MGGRLICYNGSGHPRGRIFSKVKKGDFFQPRFFGATPGGMERPSIINGGFQRGAQVAPY